MKRFSQSQGGYNGIAPQLAELVVQRGFNRSGLRLPGNEIRALQGGLFLDELDAASGVRNDLGRDADGDDGAAGAVS